MHWVCGGIVWVGNASDPINNITDDVNGGTFPQRVPVNAYYVDGNGRPFCSDKPITLIREDHLVALDLEAAYKDGSGNWHDGAGGIEHIDTKGSGWGPNAGPGGTDVIGYTGASRIAYFAGTIREGELRSRLIPHALRLWTSSAFHNKNAPGGHSWVWPATLSDSNFATAYGNSGNQYMGSLFAIPPSVNLNGIGLKTPEAMTIGVAMQNYGGYVSDTNDNLGSAEVAFSIDFKASQNEMPGQPGYTGSSSATDFSNDLNILSHYIQVVTNSHHNGGPPVGGVKIDGGDGSLRGPLAPPFNR